MIVTHRRAIAVAVGAALTTAALTTLASSADAQVGGANGLIVYDQFRSGDPGSQIWQVDPATTIESDLSGTHYGDDQASVSPDGSIIAFRSAGQIFTMTIAGKRRTSLTPHGDGNFAEPAWSPDGTKIVYVDNGELGVMDVNGDDQHVIAAGGDHAEPTWSPDGTTIAYTSSQDGHQIYAMAPDGTNIRDLSNDVTVFDEQPDWAPDSKHLLFTSNRNPCCYEIFRMAADGSGVTQIAAIYPSGSYDPAYSPDGKSLAFTSNADGTIQIFVQPVGGGSGSAVRVTNEPNNSGDENLSWQPRITTHVKVTPHRAEPGATVKVKLAGFGFSEQVAITFTDSAGVTTALGSFTTNGAGAYTAHLVIPATAATGKGSIAATGQSTGRLARAKITVT